MSRFFLCPETTRSATQERLSAGSVCLGMLFPSTRLAQGQTTSNCSLKESVSCP